MKLNIVLLFIIIALISTSCSTESKNQFVKTYNLEAFNCEKCIDCSIVVKSNSIYEARKGDSLLHSGKWTTKHDIQEGKDLLSLDNGPTNSIYPHTPSISYINVIDCKRYYCQDLLSSEYRGVIISITNLGGKEMPQMKRKRKKQITLLTESGDTIVDSPRSIFHPWLQDTCQIGDTLIKKRDALDYLLIHNGDTSFLNYPRPNCNK